MREVFSFVDPTGGIDTIYGYYTLIEEGVTIIILHLIFTRYLPFL